MATTLMAWLPQAAVFDTASRPAAAYVNATNHNYMRLNFDSAAKEDCYFQGIVPQVYGGGDTTVKIHWSAGGTGDVVWKAQFLSLADSDVLDAALSSQVNVTDSVTTANDIMIASIAMPDGGNILAGEFFFLNIERTGDDGSDTLGSDAFFLGVEVQED